MKSELIPAAPPVEKLESFPFLRRNTANGYVVLFTDNKEGVVVNSGPINLYTVGFHQERWIDCADKGVWEKLPEGTEVIIRA